MPSESRWMKGLTLSSLKKNYSLVPLFAILGFGGVLSIGYLIRLAVKSPDVSWRRTANPEPWQEYETKKYKFYQSKDIDYEQAKKERPEF